ncbi:unnamed protein product [Dovyalis caffra]|uniref:Uncharacterized protein n=1 Tax=Dovyalis caffra TaxID=77055 RepID=A0AAV1RJ04_9ROSI|nr:unnamed protein product [Dovyalis caffra]
MSASSSYRRSNRGRRGRSRSSAINPMFSAGQCTEIGFPLDTLPTSDTTPSSFSRYTSFCDYSISDDTLFSQNQNASSIYQSADFDLPIDVLGHRRSNRGRRGRSRSSAINPMFSAGQCTEIGFPLDTLPTSDTTPSSFSRYTSFCDYSISDDTLFSQNQNASSIYQSADFDLPIDVLGHRFETSHRHTTRLDAIAFDFGCIPSPGASPSCINDVLLVKRHLYSDLPHQNFRNVDSKRLVVGGS